MHRRLWQETRGYDERHGGWGFSDIDLGLRVSQICPWIELSSLGISCFHMEHPESGGRQAAIAAPNPRDFNWTVGSNDGCWGLGAFQLGEQKARLLLADQQTTQPLSAAGRRDQSSGHLAEDILNKVGSRPILEYVGRLTKLFPEGWVSRDDVEALFMLSWYGIHRHPRYYLEFGIRRGYAAAIVALASPGVEIYGVDEWRGVVSDNSDADRIAYVLKHGVYHCAYERFLNGDIRTALERLRNSFVGEFLLDLVLVRGDRFGDDLPAQITNLLPHLAPDGAIVVTCTAAGTLNSLWPEWRKQCNDALLFVSKSGSTGMIIRGVTTDPHGPTVITITCDLAIES